RLCDDLNTLAREYGAAHAANELFALSAEHHACNYLDPSTSLMERLAHGLSRLGGLPSLPRGGPSLPRGGASRPRGGPFRESRPPSRSPRSPRRVSGPREKPR